MKSVMHYEKPGSWIREVSVDDSRIHMKTVNSKNGFFGTYSEDTLVCNAEVLSGKTDDIGWYASDQKGQVLFVQLDRDIETAKKKIRQASPKLAENTGTVKTGGISGMQNNGILCLWTGAVSWTIRGICGCGGNCVQPYGICDGRP